MIFCRCLDLVFLWFLYRNFKRENRLTAVDITSIPESEGDCREFMSFRQIKIQMISIGRWVISGCTISWLHSTLKSEFPRINTN
jgi:hypothetical protein